jgi:hypothetical protein
MIYTPVLKVAAGGAASPLDLPVRPAESTLHSLADTLEERRPGPPALANPPNPALAAGFPDSY